MPDLKLKLAGAGKAQASVAGRCERRLKRKQSDRTQGNQASKDSPHCKPYASLTPIERGAVKALHVAKMRNTGHGNVP